MVVKKCRRVPKRTQCVVVLVRELSYLCQEITFVIIFTA